jgi:hypothetical protein
LSVVSSIADQLARSADLPPAEIGAYLQALHEAGLVSSGELGAETTSEAIAWAILAVLSNPDPRRAAERARDVAFFRNFRASVISFSGSDGAGSYRQPFLAPDPSLTFHRALATIVGAQRGCPEPVLPRVMISEISGDWFAAITYPVGDPSGLGLPSDCRDVVWDTYFVPESQSPHLADKLQRVSAFAPAALAGITRLLSFAGGAFLQDAGSVMPPHTRVQ